MEKVKAKLGCYSGDPDALCGGNCDFCGVGLNGIKKVRYRELEVAGSYHVGFCDIACRDNWLNLPTPIANGSGLVHRGAVHI